MGMQLLIMSLYLMSSGWAVAMTRQVVKVWVR